jgi:putative heme-binding domain-containing protein
VEKVAGPPLVRYPLFAAFDDQGRLYVAEGTGTNLPGSELAKKKLGRILLIEDRDGDGHFDTSKVFADNLVFPQGVLWHDGAVYAASHPSFWRFEDTKGLGKADWREELATGFRFNGNGCDIHGPFLGPDGRLYWTDGRHGYRLKTREGRVLEGLAARIWRCRADGSELERFCGGGFDNPVQIAFTPEGEAIGTMDQGPGDALLHFVEGGVYPMEHDCLKEFVMTGPLLGSVRQYSAALPAALCGLTRYRSAHFGKDFQDTLFSTQYMLHRIVQHRLIREGSTFRCEDKDFLTSTSHDVHITDVLEDADGSLLFVDMGAWFTYGFPGHPIPKPEVLGGIYRIRRVDAKPVVDPWGKSLKLAERTVPKLVSLLDDPRPRVQDQVLARLARIGTEAVPHLEATLRSSKQSVEARRNAVWALCRIRAPAARAALRVALADKERSVRLAAAHAAGVERDKGAAAGLLSLVTADEPPVRRQAAEALGRIGKADAVPALLDSLRKGGDRFLEHALIYALIRINNRQATLPALEDADPRVRQAGLIALDQMAAGKLTRELVVPLLDTDDAGLQHTALQVISKHPGWADAIQGLLREWLAAPKLSPDQERSLTGALLGFSGDADIQRLVVAALASPDTATPIRLLLLGVMARCPLEALPAAWLKTLGQALDPNNLTVCREAVATVKSRQLKDFDSALVALSRRKDVPAELRIAALECVAERRPTLDADAFALLTAHLSEKTDPLVRVAAARSLGVSRLASAQLDRLAEFLPATSTMVLRLLLPAYARSRDAETGKRLITALKQSPAVEALTLDELEKVLKSYPEDVQEMARGLREKTAARHQKQAAYLTGLRAELGQLQGNADAGQQVFFSQKAACSFCHRALGKGGNIGPDLSKVGRFRSTAELLEALVFPSLTIAPEFRTYHIVGKDGRTWTGMIVRETSEALFLRTTQLAELRLPRKNVEELLPAAVSLMPEGLDRTLTRQELRDVLEFLYRQK